jgi:hypothetical protein
VGVASGVEVGVGDGVVTNALDAVLRSARAVPKESAAAERMTTVTKINAAFT